MRIHFQSRPWDIYALLAYVGLVAVYLTVLEIGSLFAILFVLLVPGYLLVAALLPTNSVIDWTERILLSVGFSLAVVPLLGLILNFTPWGFNARSLAATITLFSALTGYVAHLRRMRLPVDNRLFASVSLVAPRWQDHSLSEKALSLLLGASVIASAGAVAYLLLSPRPGERFTEFFLLGADGNASSYPRALNISEPALVTFGVVNHESAIMNYTIQIDLVGIRTIYNATTQANETVEVNRTTWSWINLTLTNGAEQTEAYGFSILSAGLWKVQFLLFKDPDLSVVYREVHFHVVVT